MTEGEQGPRLPADFRFGTATSSYQIEGAVAEDGRGPSVWDTFSAEPGRIADGSSGAVACDHYHRVDEDVALLKDLGAGGYRFSISWPRVQPTGSGQVNAAGLDFYDRLVDKLLAAGVQPMVTLFHWDLPQALEDDGGWLNRATVECFADYAAIVGERLADRVEHWVPVNEPNVVTNLGYATGDARPRQVADVRLDAGGAPPAAGPRPGGDRAPLRRCDQHRLRQQPRTDLARVRRRRRRGRVQAVRRALERHVRRADAARPLPEGPRAAARGRHQSRETWRPSASPSTSTASTTTRRSGSARPARKRRCRSSSARWWATRRPTCTGRWCPTRCASG